MSLQSPSDNISQENSIENSRRSRAKQTKRKKIKKERKQASTDRSICIQDDFKTMEEIIEYCGEQDFKSSLPELIHQYRSQYRSTLHIKSVMGNDENVYKISNYESCEQEAKQYLDSVNILRNGKFHRVGIKARNIRLAVNFCLYKRKNENLKKLPSLFLRKKDAYLFERRRDVLREIEEFLRKTTNNFKENQIINKIQKEILVLCKLNTIEEHQIVTALDQFSTSNPERLNLSNFQPTGDLTDEYITLLINKNLKMAVGESPIDLLNYFKTVEIKQRNIHDDVPLQQLSSAKELKEYLKSKKPKMGHYQQHSLKTCCAGCFSNHYEIYNPIQSCPECGMRMHRSCQPIRGKCHRCKYVRKALDEKGGSQCCFLCQRGFQKGLLMQPCSWEGRQEYAHTFCLFIHNCWKIESETLVEDIKGEAVPSCICKLCLKASPFTLECCSCGKSSHGLCAYLSGSSFSFDDSGKLSFYCCRQSQLQQRLSFERKFKLNYERILYKKKSDIYSLIESMQQS